MNSNKALSRIAGSLYLIVIVGMIFGEFFVRGKLIVWGDAAATTQNILAFEDLFRLGFVIDLIAEACALLLVLALYQLLKSVNKFYAMVMVSCVVVTVAIKSLNMLNEYAAMLLLKGSTGYLSVLSTDQLNAQVLFFMNMHSTGFDIASVYYSLWLLPLGYLIYKSGSGAFSRFLGVWLIISFIALFINFAMRFLYPGFYRDTIFWISGVIDSSEIALCFWLLFKGINVK
ncbi:MAG: DUF4386 domain-containing protein [Aurantibacter sp.]